MPSPAQSWLATLFQHTESLVELRAVPNVSGEGRVAALFTRDPDEVDAFVAAWSGKPCGVFFGCGTRARKRGTKEDVVELPAVWADNDVTPKDELQAALLGCLYPPSLIVDSGRGLHPWWLLDEPQIPGPEFVALLRNLRRIFAGDPAVCDLARIMRLPGTLNTKYGEPRPVSVIHRSERRYMFSDLVDWVGSQCELVGEPVNPWLKACDELNIRSAVSLEDMEPGNIHRTQVSISASLATSGVPEDEIVATLMEATKIAAGEAGRSWNWGKEEASLREMIRSAQRKFTVVNLSQAREHKKAANGAAAPAQGKSSIIVDVAKVAMSAWGQPLITVAGELWTYEGGIWRLFDSELEHRLRVYIQMAVETLGVAPANSTLNGAYRWILERMDLVRSDVTWDRAGVVVGLNGALDLSTGAVGAHRIEHYATRRVACDIDPAAAAPTWNRFLADALPEGAASCLQEWFGAALVRGKVREMQKGLIVYGPSRTGKTQITEVVRALLGGNTCGLRVRALSDRFGMESLLTASGWVADDAVGQREEMDAEGYKVIVTGESVAVERKHKPGTVERAFDLPVLLTMNNYPIVKDDSDAVYNRTLVLPMDRQWSEEEALPIARKVVAEELSGVLNWALEGWQRLQARRRFDPPTCMLAASKDFKSQNNPMEEFVGLCLEAAATEYVMRNDLVRIFNSWMQVEYQSKSGWKGKSIALALTKNAKLKVHSDEVRLGRVWIGIRFKEAALAFDKEFGQADSRLEDLNHGFTPAFHERYGKPRRTVF